MYAHKDPSVESAHGKGFPNAKSCVSARISTTVSTLKTYHLQGLGTTHELQLEPGKEVTDTVSPSWQAVGSKALETPVTL